MRHLEFLSSFYVYYLFLNASEYNDISVHHSTVISRLYLLQVILVVKSEPSNDVQELLRVRTVLNEIRKEQLYLYAKCHVYVQ